jgi:hypothetical protein
MGHKRAKKFSVVCFEEQCPDLAGKTGAPGLSIAVDVIQARRVVRQHARASIHANARPEVIAKRSGCLCGLLKLCDPKLTGQTRQLAGVGHGGAVLCCVVCVCVFVCVCCVVFVCVCCVCLLCVVCVCVVLCLCVLCCVCVVCVCLCVLCVFVCVWCWPEAECAFAFIEVDNETSTTHHKGIISCGHGVRRSTDELGKFASCTRQTPPTGKRGGNGFQRLRPFRSLCASPRGASPP